MDDANETSGSIKRWSGRQLLIYLDDSVVTSYLRMRIFYASKKGFL
jgi:hypothetical protein